MRTVMQVGPDIRWAYVTTVYPDRVEFVGDLFQGSHAYILAVAWRPRANS